MNPDPSPESVLPDGKKALKSCRTCGKEIKGTDEPAVFCSDRCRMADLGKWFSGQHRISRPATQTDYEELDGA